MNHLSSTLFNSYLKVIFVFTSKIEFFLVDFNFIILFFFTVCSDGKGAGDLYIRCSYGMILSEIYSLEDTYYHADTETIRNYNIITQNKDTFRVSDFVLPENHEIVITFNNTPSVQIACGDSTGWTYALEFNIGSCLRYVHYSNGGTNSRNEVPFINSDDVIKIQLNGVDFKMYINDVLKLSLTAYRGYPMNIRLYPYSKYGCIDMIKVYSL